MRRAFTLVEALVALAVLAIGFSGLYLWFQAYSQQMLNDERSMRALAILRDRAEWSIAYPQSVRDTVWVIRDGTLEFVVRCEVFNATKLRAMLEERGIPAVVIDRRRPLEVRWSVEVSGLGSPRSYSLKLILGGVQHGI